MSVLWGTNHSYALPRDGRPMRWTFEGCLEQMKAYKEDKTFVVILSEISVADTLFDRTVCYGTIQSVDSGDGVITVVLSGKSYFFAKDEGPLTEYQSETPRSTCVWKQLYHRRAFIEVVTGPDIGPFCEKNFIRHLEP